MSGTKMHHFIFKPLYILISFGLHILSPGCFITFEWVPIDRRVTCRLSCLWPGGVRSGRHRVGSYWPLCDVLVVVSVTRRSTFRKASSGFLLTTSTTRWCVSW